MSDCRPDDHAAWARKVAHVAQTFGFSVLSLPSPSGPGLAVRGNERVLLLGAQDVDAPPRRCEDLLHLADADAVWVPSRGWRRSDAVRDRVVQYFPLGKH
jgi:hypothetical protein